MEGEFFAPPSPYMVQLTEYYEPVRYVPPEKAGIYLKNVFNGRYVPWDDRLLLEYAPVPTQVWVEVPAEEYFNRIKKPLPEWLQKIPAARIQKADTAQTPATMTEDTAPLPNANSAIMEGVSDGGENHR